MPSHTQFNYFFSDVEGITFEEVYLPITLEGDLLIYYDDLSNPHFIDCRCSGWEVDNYEVSVRTWLKKDDLQTLISNTVPGAAGELYKILGTPTYYDKTWEGENTIRLVPTSSSTYSTLNNSFEGSNNSTLIEKREPRTIYVKNISTHPLESVDYWIEVKIDGYVSGSRR